MQGLNNFRLLFKTSLLSLINRQFTNLNRQLTNHKANKSLKLRATVSLNYLFILLN